MAKKLSPRERLDEKGRAACQNYRPAAVRCAQCAQARLLSLLRRGQSLDVPADVFI